MKTFIYPGSFDPITNGHVDVIKRAAALCDKLIVGVLINVTKKTVLTLDERVELINKCVGDMPNVEVTSFSGLLVDFAKENNVNTIVKGLRAVSDFEYELQMAFLNKQLNEDIETIFLMASQKYSFLSSSVVRDLAIHGADVSELVPEVIAKDVVDKYSIGNMEG